MFPSRVDLVCLGRASPIVVEEARRKGPACEQSAASPPLTYRPQPAPLLSSPSRPARPGEAAKASLSSHCIYYACPAWTQGRKRTRQTTPRPLRLAELYQTAPNTRGSHKTASSLAPAVAWETLVPPPLLTRYLVTYAEDWPQQQRQRQPPLLLYFSSTPSPTNLRLRPPAPR